MAQSLYGSDAANLTASQKDTVAALTTLAGSLAGGLAGGNAASALAGGQGAKNEVENNYLTFAQTMQRDRELVACQGAFGHPRAATPFEKLGALVSVIDACATRWPPTASLIV